MDTKKTIHFVILIPHRDAGSHLEEYRQKLFSGGVSGAHSFPAAAPLAEVSRSFSREELKELAQNIRRLSLERDGKIQGSMTNAIVKTGQMSFFGPKLNLSISEDTFPSTSKEKIIRILSPPVLCAALIEPKAYDLNHEEAPAISFKAASLANLAIRPLAVEPGNSMEYSIEYSYEWKICLRVWLPAFKKA